LTKARTLVEQADKSQAQRYAAADLQRARDELGGAETASNQGHTDAARNLAEAAAVDADVASARGQAGEAQHAVQEAVQGNRTLEHESRHASQTAAPAPAPPDRGAASPPPDRPAPPPDATSPPPDIKR
jgi:hypothetical protein